MQLTLECATLGVFVRCHFEREPASAGQVFQDVAAALAAPAGFVALLDGLDGATEELSRVAGLLEIPDGALHLVLRAAAEVDRRQECASRAHGVGAGKIDLTTTGMELP